MRGEVEDSPDSGEGFSLSLLSFFLGMPPGFCAEEAMLDITGVSGESFLSSALLLPLENFSDVRLGVVVNVLGVVVVDLGGILLYLVISPPSPPSCCSSSSSSMAVPTLLSVLMVLSLRRGDSSSSSLFVPALLEASRNDDVSHEGDLSMLRAELVLCICDGPGEDRPADALAAAVAAAIIPPVPAAGGLNASADAAIAPATLGDRLVMLAPPA
mmetsp:Transcript_50937/g.94324  ORF Transcript_50937/g.94324 Transcript_50937/m.94324 type:complete len:214 (+) Transcript_50937:98-739(+)